MTNPVDDAEALIESDPDAAAEQLGQWLGDNPLDARAYRLLHRALGRDSEAPSRQGQVRSNIPALDPALRRVVEALNRDDLESAEIILRPWLLHRPGDPIALHLMGKFANALGFVDEAIALIELALEHDRQLIPARQDLASIHYGRFEVLEAIEIITPLLDQDPDNVPANILMAGALFRIGRLDEAVAVHERILSLAPNNPMLWWTFGNYLKTIGRAAEGALAIRRALEIEPNESEAWLALANLKTAQFNDDDIAAMRRSLRVATKPEDRAHLHFALGKALEDSGEARAAFREYVEANAAWKETVDYDPDGITNQVTWATQVFTPSLLKSRAGQGDPSPDPIFVIGMTRAGSTLVEQILSCHSQIEGTMELPYIGLIARGLGQWDSGYQERLARLSSEELRNIGAQYLRRAARHRTTKKPFFIDKLPNNWLHIPLIRLILPNARIIDVRRHPLACGVSNFRQHFAMGQNATYDLEWFGRFYRDYVRMLSHFDKVEPGRIHRVIYERLVEDTEGEVKAMLDYLGLPFEDACLRHHESARAVFTPSAEQVRQPIDATKATSWRVYDDQLAPLKAALGPVLDLYPDVPQFEEP